MGLHLLNSNASMMRRLGSTASILGRDDSVDAVARCTLDSSTSLARRLGSETSMMRRLDSSSTLRRRNSTLSILRSGGSETELQPRMGSVVMLPAGVGRFLTKSFIVKVRSQSLCGIDSGTHSHQTVTDPSPQQVIPILS